MSARDEREELAALDEKLLEGHVDLDAADRLLDRRMELVRGLCAQAQSVDELAELEVKNRRLTEWLFHRRRVTLIESAAIEQHHRFLAAAGEQREVQASLEVLG